MVAAAPLRLGYVSRRFEDYAGTQLMLGLFAAHNRSRVQVRSPTSTAPLFSLTAPRHA